MQEKEYIIPPEGSLGLLAIGHVGLFAWRKARLEYENKTGLSFQSFYTKEKDTKNTIDNYTKLINEKA